MVLAFAQLKRGSAERKKLEQILKATRENTSSEDIRWAIELMEKLGIKDQAKRDFDLCLTEANTPSLWEEVIRYLSEWLSEKVKGF